MARNSVGWLGAVVFSSLLTSPSNAQSTIIAQASQIVSPTGRDVGGGGLYPGKRGEDRKCGDVVTCGTVTVTVPSGKEVHSIVIDVSDNHDGWQTGPLGWSSWESKTDNTLADGRRQISATLKNWSEDRARTIRITVF